jgi:hypothetical protein
MERHPDRSAIESYLEAVTADGPGFVSHEERIATFDNDGTLWSEKPIPIQALGASSVGAP